jgi:recombination protein RecT
VAEQQRNKGQNRGGQRKSPSEQPQSENQQISVVQNRQDRTRTIMGLVEKMRGPIEAVLPVHISIDKFRAIVLMALRKAPNVGKTILDCHPPSIITACLSAAYDGLMPDGREGAMIASNNKYLDESGREQWRNEARWNPMVAGLRKQILAGGEVADAITTIVYENEIKQGRFKVTAGLDPNIEHTPMPETDRGDPAAAYAVAFFRDDRRPTFEVMYKGEIEYVRATAKGGAVWNSYPLEMWRKTVLRRFRKSLPGGNDIVDMEAREMFPDFNGDQEALPAPPKPTRASVQARLEDQQGSMGEPLDFGDDLGRFAQVKEEVEAQVDHDAETGEIRREHVEQGESREAGGNHVESLGGTAENSQSGSEETGKMTESRDDANRTDAAPIPETPEQWAMWWTGVKAKLDKCSSSDAVTRLRNKHKTAIAAAQPPLSNEIGDAFFEANTDIVTGSRSGGAEASDAGNSTSAGEQA